MNTPAHIVLNMICLGRQDTTGILAPVIIGAILPDAPMFVFYFVERVIKGTPESSIWRDAYYQTGWQNFIDCFNSIPLIMGGAIIALWLSSKMGLVLLASMALHVLGDLPLHHYDAHRHFFPLSNWRFHSPISYWDPAFHGDLVTRLEILMVIVSCVVLLLMYQSVPARFTVGAVGMSYVAFFIYAFMVWI